MLSRSLKVTDHCCHINSIVYMTGMEVKIKMEKIHIYIYKYMYMYISMCQKVKYFRQNENTTKYVYYLKRKRDYVIV